ncbi:MAG: SDR family NAD(P)-dependent oxidoreductase [Ginsengibacter sp.]
MIGRKEIQGWLINYLAELLQQTPASIDILEPFANYGLSSLNAVTLSGELEELLDRRLSPTLAYEYPNISALSRHLAGDEENNTPGAESTPFKDALAEPIAIIGMACRFPGADDPQSFWQLLHDGVDAISEVPPGRWDKHAYYDPDPAIAGKSFSQWGGFLKQIDEFDPFFFGISPVEAKYMDPQQRLLLELSYEAMDDADQTMEKLAGTTTGVFIGISGNEYSSFQYDDPAIITSHSGTGSALSIAANRISYYFDLHGPSLALDTACSSSLSAVHLACQSLRNGECRMAFAGGVNLILSPAPSIAFTKAGVMAPDGRCKTFDGSANGYVRGEGGGVIVLKELSSALADGDNIHAVIMGSAIRQDGRTNGLMAPNPEAQEAMLREAYLAAGIEPAKVQYVEAHGTGTLLGDAMEVKALGVVIGANRENGPCSIGSVKTNIGHLEAAAGMAGLLKVILSLKHRLIPPSLHYHSPNPHISFEDLNLRVNNELTPWPAVPGAALAGLSSFGFGGTNVHMIIREADFYDEEKIDNEQADLHSANCYLLPLSANSSEALHSTAAAFGKMLASDFAVATNDICSAAAHRRSHFYYRLAITGDSREELCNKLQAFSLEGQQANNLIIKKPEKQKPKLVFVFPGQGGQWLGMGRELLAQEPIFLKEIERISEVIELSFHWSLMDALCSDESISKFNEIDVIQPCLFAIQVALSALWQSWGITPDTVIGHSMGEIVAAYTAGVITLEDAIQIVCCRSRLLRRLRGKGKMMVTDLSALEAKELLQPYQNRIGIAAINSPTSTVLSGESLKIDEVMDDLKRRNFFCRLVNVDVASHSFQMDELQDDLLKMLDGLKTKSAKIPIYSTVSGSLGNELNFNAAYWMDNLRKPVLFSDTISQLFKDGYSVFIEISPHPVLLSCIQQTLASANGNIRLLASLRREEGERKVLHEALATLYTEGFSILWDKLYPKIGKHVELPPIPWQRQRYWLDIKQTGSKPTRNFILSRSQDFHPLLGERITVANSPLTFIWQTSISDEMLRLLGDHRVENEIVFPAAAYIEMALQSAEEAGVSKSHLLSNFVFNERMILQGGKSNSLQALLSPAEEGNFLFSIYGRAETHDNWKMYASVYLIERNTADLSSSMEASPEVIRQNYDLQQSGEDFYKTLQSHGVQYGPAFRSIQQIWSKDNEALALVGLPESLLNDISGYQLHPALLDACLQVIAATQTASLEQDLYLPVSCKYVRIFSPPERILWSHVAAQSEPIPYANNIIADVRLLDESDRAIAEIIGFRLQKISRYASPSLLQQNIWLYEPQWRVQEAVSSSNGTMHETKHWLIFSDDNGLAEGLANQLELAGDHCHLLPYVETIERLDGLEDEATLQQIIDDHLEEVGTLYGVIHFWSLTSSPAKSSYESAPMSGCDGILILVKALARRITGLPRLWLVTRGAQAVKAGDQISIEQSVLWGFGKVISFEFPDCKCVRLDLDPQESDTTIIKLLTKQISIDDNEDQVALRAGVRFVPRLAPLTLSQNFIGPRTLQHDGTYLITGGLGALGLVTAKWMVQHGAKYLVLVGRNEPTQIALSIVDEIRRQGVEVAVALADVSNHSQLDNVFENIKLTMPALKGIIHAAGVLDDCSILNLDSVRMKNVMAPKVGGTWNLHRASLHLPLDFFVLYSSAVSVLGAPGQGNYAAACSFLDAMAHYRHNLGLPAISINWGPWAEIGLAAAATEKLMEQNAFTEHLIKTIKVNDGLEILERLLDEPVPQVMVLPFDLKNLIELYPTAAGISFLSEVGGNTYVTQLYSRPGLQQEYIAPRNEIEKKLADLWRKTLHIDRVGIHDSFFELGGDSVLAAQILGSAQKTFGIRIDPRDAFQAFTVKRLAELLQDEMLKQVDEMTEEEAQKILSGKN